MHLAAGFAAALCLSLAAPAHGQSWPTKPVRLVVAFPPGTPGDIIARLVQPTLQQAWGQSVIVENRPGAGGNLAASEVVRAKDGHTLLVGPDTILTVNPHVYRKLAFNLREALKPVTYFASFNQVLVCHPATGIRSLDAFARQPATAMYASGGSGSPSHMAMAMLLGALGTQLVHVPYKGPGPAAQDVMAGHVPCSFVVGSVVLQHVQGGRLEALAVSGGERSVVLPTVPTVAESGHPGFDATFFETLMAPADTRPAVIEKIHQDVRQALRKADVKTRLADLDLRVEGNTPDEARRRGEADFRKWGAIAGREKLQLD